MALYYCGPGLWLHPVSGFLTYVVCVSVFPHIITKSLASNVGKADAGTLKSYFEVEMPPVFGVMTALLLSFVVGLGLSMVPRGVLRKASSSSAPSLPASIETIIIRCCRCTSSASS